MNCIKIAIHKTFRYQLKKEQTFNLKDATDIFNVSIELK